MTIDRRALLKAGLIGLGSQLPIIRRATAATGSVKIGVLGDYSSAYASVGGTALLEAVKMAIEDTGQVLGKPVELVHADCQLKIDIGTNIARRWFEREDVDVVVDIPHSGITLAVADLALPRRKIVLATSAVSSDITGAKCSPYVAHWTFDTYGIANSTAWALVKSGALKWFFITMDTVAGTAIERDATAVLTAGGGKVVGSVRVPINTPDFSSFLLHAQGSGADVLFFSVAGADAVNLMKQASEFGISNSMRLAGSFTMPDDVRGMGLRIAQGLVYSAAFEWDLNDETRAFSKRFLARAGKTPNMNMAGSYSAVSHYLKAVQKAGSKEADVVMSTMRETPINDAFARNGRLRVDGKMEHGMYVMQVKKPSESANEWDIAKLVAEIPANVATRPLAEGNCPLVK
jgi:branched-chain amino acid transport system substrate-binding protein